VGAVATFGQSCVERKSHAFEKNKLIKNKNKNKKEI
jgi:hypothetical protein